MIAIDHPIDCESLLKFHTVVLGGEKKKKNSMLELFYVGGLTDSNIIILGANRYLTTLISCMLT